MRTLLLLRHAQAEDVRPGSADRDRRLSEDGERQAMSVGEHLRADGAPVDLVLSSSAVRARQTAELLGLPAPLVVTDELYNAGGESILALIGELEDDAERVVIVAHAPGLPWVAWELADPEASDAAALAAIEYRFPPATLAVLSVEGTWADLSRAALVAARLPG
jgi:phosphohistidine phosphatase